MKHSFLVQIDIDQDAPLENAQKLAEALLKATKLMEEDAVDIEVQYLGAN